MLNHFMFLYNESLQLWNVIFPSMVLRIIIFELEGMPHFIFYLMTWSICHAFIYGFIVKQVCFVPWCSVGFLEWLLIYGDLPKFPRFPSLSMVPYWDFCNYLGNYSTPFLSKLFMTFKNYTRKEFLNIFFKVWKCSLFTLLCQLNFKIEI